ncbi:MAG TPA: alcohol dehydrogenase catalytic domain-containing protein, partial [Actinomycetota bacterium]|nr:alcohol dehydrogenase catalytic domain-containing protein [Actinomycetota bacterium]
MKALVLAGPNGMDDVWIAEVADPVAGPSEVVVRLEAAALNHLDLWTIGGTLNVDHEFPHVLGADGAGVIEEVGADVVGLEPGMRVIVDPGHSCGRCERCLAGEASECRSFRMLGEHLHGTFAERVKVPATNVFPYPDYLTTAEAAALGVTFITAYRMLFTRGGLRPGEWVL